MRLTTAFLFLSLSATAQIDFVENATRLTGHGTTVWDAEYSPDGSLVAAGGGSNQVIVWRGKEEVFRTPESDHPVNFVDFNNEGTVLAYAAYYGTGIVFLDAETGDELMTISEMYSVDNFEFSPTESVLVVAGRKENQYNQTIKLFDTETGELIMQLFEDEEAFPTAVAFSPDGEYVACGISNADQGITIWEVATGEVYREIKHDADVSAITWSPDGKEIAGGGIDKRVTVWDVKSGEVELELSAMDGYVSAIDISDDGNYLAACGMDHTCRFKVWEMKTGDLVNTVGGRGPDINSIHFVPDGHSVLIGLRTYGDLFEAPTVEIHATQDAFAEEPWYDVEYRAGGCIVSFPEQPEITETNQGSYVYHRLLLMDDATQMVDIIEYQSEMTADQIAAEVTRIGSSYSSRIGGEIVSQTEFKQGGLTGDDFVLQKDDLRYRFRITGNESFMYYITYVSYEKSETAKEKRFIESLSVN